jgi:hypothetical protein
MEKRLLIGAAGVVLTTLLLLLAQLGASQAAMMSLAH